jgi:hypothetical protein
MTKAIDINRQDNYGNTALHYACYHSKPLIVKTLIKNGANVNIPGYMNYTPLHYTCIYSGNVEIIHYLIHKRCFMDVKDNHGNTALHIACMKNDYQVVKLLIQGNFDVINYERSKIDLDEKNNMNLSAIELTTDSNIKDLIKNKIIHNRKLDVLYEDHGYLYKKIQFNLRKLNIELSLYEIITKLENMNDLISVFHQIGNFNNEIVEVMSKRIYESFSVKN